MGHYWSEVASEKTKIVHCMNCGEAREVSVDSFYNHSESSCIRHLKSRIDALEKAIHALEDPQ